MLVIWFINNDKYMKVLKLHKSHASTDKVTKSTSLNK